MIKSMTGFGRSEIERGNRKITVEIKSVNHRFLENSIKMPKKLNIFEARIRDTIKKYASRGKIDVFITYEDNSESNVSLKFNESIAREYMNIFRQMEERFNIRNDITVGALSRYPEVITMEESQEDEEELWNFINEAIEEACKGLADTRIIEGENLKNDLLLKLDHMEELVSYIETKNPQIIEDYKKKLEAKMEEILSDADIDNGSEAVSDKEMQQAMIYVDVCGAVANPGVFQLAAGSRVFQAIEAAGGYLPEAALTCVNRAGVLTDGQQLYILTQEEMERQGLDPAEMSGASDGQMNGSAGTGQNTGMTAQVQQDNRININTADEAQLTTLTGIGATRAQAIIAYREENGPFAAIEDIMNVQGIKEGTFAKIKDEIVVG